LEEPVVKSAYGPLFFLVPALVFLVGSYAMWPPHFIGTPFSEMTSGVLLRAIASPTLAAIGLEFVAALLIVTLSDR